MNRSTEYPVLIRSLPAADGGGFVALVPDLPG
jgi:antitoxin HicB